MYTCLYFEICIEGSPPRHLKEAVERMKKIPSLFDIQTFPPGQSPKKPPQQGPPGHHPQMQMGGPHGQPPSQRCVITLISD